VSGDILRPYRHRNEQGGDTQPARHSTMSNSKYKEEGEKEGFSGKQ
jgi:hypothetical protein